MKSFLKFENKGTITGKTSLWDVCSLYGCVIGRVKWLAVAMGRQPNYGLRLCLRRRACLGELLRT